MHVAPTAHLGMLRISSAYDAARSSGAMVEVASADGSADDADLPRTRRLVRVGRLEFMLEPEQALHFNFILVRRDRGVSARPRLKKSAYESDGGDRG